MKKVIIIIILCTFCLSCNEPTPQDRVEQLRLDVEDLIERFNHIQVADAIQQLEYFVKSDDCPPFTLLYEIDNRLINYADNSQIERYEILKSDLETNGCIILN